MKKGDFVKEKQYGWEGLIGDVYENWNDYKARTEFVTIDPDNESENMDAIEKLINGDPKDKWLEMQSIPFTEEQLEERWFQVFVGEGSCASCESRLIVINNF